MNRNAILTVMLLGTASALAQDHHEHHHHDPPPEALAACTQHTRDQACTFQAPDGDRVEGTCVAPEGRPLACMPPHSDHDCGHRGPPPGAIQACHDIAIGDACVVDTPHGHVEGTCRETPHGNACVPDHPH